MTEVVKLPPAKVKSEDPSLSGVLKETNRGYNDDCEAER